MSYNDMPLPSLEEQIAKAPPPASKSVEDKAAIAATRTLKRSRSWVGTENGKKDVREYRRSLNIPNNENYLHLSIEAPRKKTRKSLFVECPFIILKLFKEFDQLSGARWADQSPISSPHAFHFLKKMLSSADDLQKYASNEDGLKKCLGQLIFILDYNPSLLPSNLDPQNFENSAEKVQAGFVKALSRIKKQIKKVGSIRKKARLKHCKSIEYTMIAREIGKILMTKTGRVNVWIIDDLIKEFNLTEEPLIGFKKNLYKSLRILSSSECICEKLEAVVRPDKPEDSINEIIRAELALPHDIPITDIHAKTASLCSFLYPIRQSTSISCFSTYFLIELKALFPEKIVEDLHSLLKNNCLERHVQGKVMEFPFLSKMSNEMLEQKISVQRDGSIQNSGHTALYVWEIPEVAAAAEAMGIRDLTADMLWVLRKKAKKGSFSISLFSIVQQLARKNGKEPLEISQLILRGSLAIKAFSDDPLLRVYENTLSGMAEASDDSLLRAALFKTIYYLIKKQFLSTPEFPIIEESAASLKLYLFNRTRFLFDPEFLRSKETPLRGAFILFDLKGAKSFNEWRHIDTSEKFKLFAISLIEDIYHEHPRILKNLKHFIASRDFIKEALNKYYKSERRSIEDKLRYTPWISMIGNDPKAVARIYGESTFPAKTQIIKPENAESLVLHLIKLGEELSEEVKELYRKDQDIPMPIRIPGIHAFSLLLGHPTLLDYWDGFHGPINERMDALALSTNQIASLAITKNMKNKLIKFTIKHMSDPGTKKRLEELLGKDNELSLIGMRNSIKKFCEENPDHMTKPLLNFLRSYDLMCIKVLPKFYKRTYEASIIHFADSNWRKGIHDLHYGIGINPMNGQWELMEVLDKGLVNRLIDQTKFFNGQEWEIKQPDAI